MDPKTYHRLHSTDATPASFYGLPKIHKPDVPLRPITSCINAPTYNVSQHLVSILSSLLEEKYSVTTVLCLRSTSETNQLQKTGSWYCSMLLHYLQPFL